MPELFEVVINPAEGIEALPDPNVPYYVLAGEGLFLHRKTQIGNVLLREYKTPPVPKTGYSQGIFTWDAPTIPGKIISQATDFFRRIYQKYHTEAEVLITMHNDTKEFRLFVPFQRVSHAGVKSIFEPTHIDRNYTVVGTIHSHCDFSAFHSGTDSADASDMDGVHFTIGMITQEKPQIVAMVAMNKKEFHYTDPATIAEIVFDADTAPPWWDEYVFPAETESEKPKSLKSITQEQWNQFRNIAPRKVTTHTTNTTPPYYSPAPYRSQHTRPWVPSEDRVIPFRPQPTRESREFNKKKRYTRPYWNKDGSLGLNEMDQLTIDIAIDDGETTGILQQDEIDHATQAQKDSIEYWQLVFTAKMEAAIDILDTLGITVDVTIKKKAKQAPVTGQMGLYELLPEN